MHGFLRKPLTSRLLQETIQRVSSERRPAPEPGAELVDL
jgi:hypothetical protein